MIRKRLILLMIICFIFNNFNCYATNNTANNTNNEEDDIVETIEYKIENISDLVKFITEQGQTFKLYQKLILTNKGEGNEINYVPEAIHYITASESETAPMILFDDEISYWFSLSNHNKNEANTNNIIIKTSGITHDDKCNNKDANAAVVVNVKDLTDYKNFTNILKAEYPEQMDIDVGNIFKPDVTETLIPKFNYWFTGFKDKIDNKIVLYKDKNDIKTVNDLQKLLGATIGVIPLSPKTGEFIFKAPINRIIQPDLNYIYACNGCGATGTVTITNENLIKTKNSGDYQINYLYGEENTGNIEPTLLDWADKTEYFGKEYGKGNSLKDKNILHTSKKTINFYPYIKMRYATANNKDLKPVYTVSQNISKINENIVVNTSTEELKANTIELTSQWSNNNTGLSTLNSNGIKDKDALTLGGANINIKTHNNTNEKISTNHILVESYITCVPDNIKNNFTQYTYSEEDAISELTKFRNSIKNTLSDYIIEKWVAPGIYNNETSFLQNAVCVNGINQVKTFGKNTLNINDKKYYINKNTNKITPKFNNEIVDIYKVQPNTEGDILLYKNNIYQGCIYRSQHEGKYNNTLLKEIGENNEWFNLNTNTKIIDNIILGLDRNLGKSGRYGGYLGWYNEAIDGISIVKQILDITLEVNDTLFDIQDTALTGTLDNNYDLFSNKDLANKWRTLQYRLSTKTYDSDMFVIGKLNGNNIYLNNIDNVLTSKLFYLSNATVELN